MSIHNVCKKVLFRAYDRFINCNAVQSVDSDSGQSTDLSQDSLQDSIVVEDH